MLDIQFIRENLKLVQEAAEKKNTKVDLEKLLELDDERRTIQQEGDQLRARRNEIAEQLKDADKRTPELMQEGKSLKERLAGIEDKERQIQEVFNGLMLQVPNIPSVDTPIGPDESSNEEVARVGEPRSFDFKVKDHTTLGTELDILDLERGVKVSGFRGYFLKNEGAQMHLAILQYSLNKLISKGFVPFVVPTIVREEALVNMGQFPAHRAETYQVISGDSEEGEKKYLAGTAEVALLNYFSDQIFEKAELPIKACGFSSCYRAEAGAHGKDAKGLYRVHEFAKIEQLVVAENNLEQSLELLMELRGVSEEILNDLGLPYRVIITSTGDQGLGKHKMFDIETWMPSRENYGETHSDSLLTDWQARRANIRYRDDGGELKYAHTLNNTAIASPRILIAIWENYQQADGSIRIPEVLVPYMGGKTEISAK